MNYKSLFLDTEFTGLYRDTSLISLAMVADTGEYFYAEFTDYPESLITEWLQAHVIDHLVLDKPVSLPPGGTTWRGNQAEVSAALKHWLQELHRQYPEQPFRFWADVPHYDWVLFCELFGGALYLPEFIHYMPMDLATLLYAREMDPDTPRASLSSSPSSDFLRPHNALYDALLIREILNRL